MDIAEQIFEKHIGLNAEMKYKSINKQDVIDCINEALTKAENLPISDVSNSETWLCMDAGKNKKRCEKQCSFCGDF